VSGRATTAILLLAGAGLLQLGIAGPAGRDRDQARADYARAREERQALRARVAEAERRAAALATTPAGDASAARAMRASLLRATAGLSLSEVRIAASADGKGPAAARGSLSAAGSLAAILRLSGRLARSSSGLLLERVRLSRVRGVTGRVRIEVDGFNLREAS
jgi:hypothetical protein